jgi:hypothetical protein
MPVLTLAFVAFLVVGMVRSIEFQERSEYYRRHGTGVGYTGGYGGNLRRLREWNDLMARKYRNAAWLPWLPVSPDTEPPRVIMGSKRSKPLEAASPSEL